MSESVSEQLSELAKEVGDSLVKLNMLIENRGAWVDGIEGCREGAALLKHAHERLQSINETAHHLESTLISARAELERWSKMHTELSTVERELRAECDQRRVALEQKDAAFVRARQMAREFIKELT